MDELMIYYDEKPKYNIVYSDSYDDLADYLIDLGFEGKNICVVSESKVASFYMDAILRSIHKVSDRIITHIFAEGEASKNLKTVETLYEHLIKEKFNRSDLLIALGGGVVGDLTGFAAATYLRGIDFIQVPTSLLSQVDSSIGGKTGVDFNAYKNMVGAFHMPRLVYTNINALKTLDDRQFVSGMGEIIKHGLIKDADYFNWLNDKHSLILDKDYDTLKEMVYVSNIVKKNVVEKDPTEKGERALLNLGHTLGHAIEKYMNFSFMHGECVLYGCILSTIISYNKGLIDKITKDCIISTIMKYDLPKIPDSIDIKEIVKLTRNDKKSIGSKVKFVLIDGIGSSLISLDVTEEDMIKAMEELLKGIN